MLPDQSAQGTTTYTRGPMGILLESNPPSPTPLTRGGAHRVLAATATNPASACFAGPPGQDMRLPQLEATKSCQANRQLPTTTDPSPPLRTTCDVNTIVMKCICTVCTSQTHAHNYLRITLGVTSMSLHALTNLPHTSLCAEMDCLRPLCQDTFPMQFTPSSPSCNSMHAQQQHAGPHTTTTGT
jgi:hypothetical protein